jgi:hypothetical protein
MRFNEKYQSRLPLGIFLVGAIGLAILQGCHATKPQAQKLFVVLVDETESFALYEQRGVIERMYWEAVVDTLIPKIVNSLEAGCAFTIIGIDEHGFDAEDVRMPLTVLPQGFLESKMEKDKLARNVRELKQRQQRHRKTDILGALYHAAYFTSRYPERKAVIFCFSDMRQEPTWPTQEQARALKFPEGTEAYFFYVNASGRTNWERMVQVWEPILTEAGLQLYTYNSLSFFQSGESALWLERILSDLSRR